jgi:hypothetical protein
MIRDLGVGELVEELEQRGDRLPFEIGAFVALEACEGLLQESVKLEPDDVRVTLEGSVVVAESAPPAAPEEAADSLVSVLARLLIAAGPGVPPYLLQLVKETKTGHTPRGLRDLHDAIEASLIPINRGASRRVLARLVRESDRPPAPETPQVDPHALDAELDELLRDPALRTQGAELEPPPVEEPVVEEPITERIRIPRRVWADTDTVAGADTDVDAATVAPKTFPPPIPDTQPETLPVPPSEPALTGASVPIPDLGAPAAAATAPKQREIQEPITATIRKWQPQEEPAPDPAIRPALDTPTESAFGAGSVAASESIPSPEPLPQRPSRPTAAPEQPYDRPSLPQQPPKRRGGWGIWLLAAGLGLGAYAVMATGTLDSLLQTETPAPAVGGTIDVTVNPADAQIFVFIGRGPAVVEGLAVDSAHEFIVFDQGLRPSRAIVPKGATWATSESGPLYELAVQAQPAEPSGGSSDLGAPQTEAGASTAGATGAVRVITNPPRAKVYRFVGPGPSAEISVSSIHEGQEVLVFHPGHETRRAVIGPSDWEKTAGGHGASLSVELPALPDSAPAETPED